MKTFFRSILLLLSFTSTQAKAQQYVDQTHDEYYPVKIYKNEFNKIEKERSFNAGASTDQINQNKSFNTNVQDNQNNTQTNSYSTEINQNNLNLESLAAEETICQIEKNLVNKYFPQQNEGPGGHCTPAGRTCFLTGR